MILFEWVATFFHWIGYNLDKFADWADDIPIVGEWLAYYIRVVAVYFYYIDPSTGKVGQYCLYYKFYELSWWANNVIESLKGILSWETIKKLILSWLPDLTGLFEWFSDWWWAILNKVQDWWASVTTTVKSWIAIAVEGLSSLLVAWNNFWTITWPAWTSSFNTLATAWNNFWTLTFPTLVNVSWAWNWWKGRFTEVGLFVDSQFKERFPFYNELVIFFDDPLQYVYDRLEGWFERFW